MRNIINIGIIAVVFITCSPKQDGINTTYQNHLNKREVIRLEKEIEALKAELTNDIKVWTTNSTDSNIVDIIKQIKDKEQIINKNK
tara:strand:- start:1254 stop:1511 length:258 start_codon:yes stop_codon:yes gene_type:complete